MVFIFVICNASASNATATDSIWQHTCKSKCRFSKYFRRMDYTWINAITLETDSIWQHLNTTFSYIKRFYFVIVLVIVFIGHFHFVRYQGTDSREHFAPLVTKFWRAPLATQCYGGSYFDMPPPLSPPFRDTNDIDVNIERAARRRDTTDVNEVTSMSLSNTAAKPPAIHFSAALLFCIIFSKLLMAT